MKVMIGVCGIGFGHSMRQREVAERLRSEGHDIEVVSTPALTPLFRALGFKSHDVWLPIIPGSKRGISIHRSITSNLCSLGPGVMAYLDLRGWLRDHGVPDVFVTDYEPNVARLAYHFQRPLISIDQQSKFRFFDFEPIGGFNQSEERARLTFLFPQVTHNFIISFYRIASQRREISVIPPILPRALRTKTLLARDLVLVYFSNYLGQGQTRSLSSIAALFSNHPHLTFHVYLHPREYDRNTISDFGNVSFLAFDRNAFLEDLCSSRCVIANAGHNLISEALWLERPLFVMPLNTYDQHYCGQVIEYHQFGMCRPHLSPETLDSFLGRQDIFRNNIRSSDILNYGSNALDNIAEFIERRSWGS
jgi:uncharacterized protein (TIGR00661 family)